MRLRVKNFAKILDADIEIDGITIITGNNNTGKSTVGKILDAVFNTTQDIDEKMYAVRRRSLSAKIKAVLEEYQDGNDLRKLRMPYSTYRRFAEDLIENGSEDCEKICRQYIDSSFLGIRNEISWIEKIKECLEANERISEESLSRTIYTEYFGEVFHGQVNSIYRRDELAEIKLTIKNGDIKLAFEDDTCIHAIRERDIYSNSIYIDDPFVLDEMNNNHFMSYSELPMHKRNIIEKLREKEDRTVAEKAFANLLMKEKLEDIISVMNKVADGKVTKRQKYMYQMREDASKELDVASLSTGLKAFVILKQLLVNGSLQEKDVIVLDEPEIHLHPEWQLLYAELIVLLQKKFNFHIIVTTHSAHFMEALELYSKKYGIEKRCRYYLTSLKKNGALFENVTGDLSKIYKQMVDPTLLLSQLREELETEDDKL